MTVLRGTMGVTADGRVLVLVQKDVSEGLPALRPVGYVTQRRFQANSVEAGHDDSSIRPMA